MTQFSPSQGGFQAPEREVKSPAVNHLSLNRDFNYVAYLEVLSQETENEGR